MDIFSLSFVRVIRSYLEFIPLSLMPKLVSIFWSRPRPFSSAMAYGIFALFAGAGHPHMFISAAEYAQLSASRSYPTVWRDSAQGEGAAGRQSPLLSPHAALRYTVPPNYDNQVSWCYK